MYYFISSMTNNLILNIMSQNVNEMLNITLNSICLVMAYVNI
jgi:hypothetical protein